MRRIWGVATIRDGLIVGVQGHHRRKASAQRAAEVLTALQRDEDQSTLHFRVVARSDGREPNWGERPRPRETAGNADTPVRPAMNLSFGPLTDLQPQPHLEASAHQPEPVDLTTPLDIDLRDPVAVDDLEDVDELDAVNAAEGDLGDATQRGSDAPAPARRDGEHHLIVWTADGPRCGVFIAAVPDESGARRLAGLGALLEQRRLVERWEVGLGTELLRRYGSPGLELMSAWRIADGLRRAACQALGARDASWAELAWMPVSSGAAAAAASAVAGSGADAALQ